MMPRWTRAVGPAALLLSLMLLATTWRLRPPAPPQLGRPFPAAVLTALGNTPLLTDADLRQNRVSVVNLFASWCMPCRVEAPQLAALQKAGQNSGYAVIGIAVRDTAGDAARFVRETGVRFDRGGVDAKGGIQSALQADGIPETYVVDGHGIIRYRHPGELRPEHLAALRAAIEDAR